MPARGPYVIEVNCVEPRHSESDLKLNVSGQYEHIPLTNCGNRSIAQTESLEQAFLQLTGTQIRAESAGGMEDMRRFARSMGRR